jgi:dTDP-glucose 4,6-dehydratase
VTNTKRRQRILVTGGAGFIGSALVRRLIRTGGITVLNCDKFTYAAVPGALEETANDLGYRLCRIDICDRQSVESVFRDYHPDGIIHLAAETHVDRSIDGPLEFVRTNVLGTAVLLDVSNSYYRNLNQAQRQKFRFHHVSTDEVFGALNVIDAPFCEKSPYAPNSPYSASKAGADHLVRAWHRTLGLPVVMTHGSNTFGPWQFPDKFIPMMIISALRGEPLPIYGNGGNVRDWLFIEDHADALWQTFCAGTIGESYNIGGGSEFTNIAVAVKICQLLDRIHTESPYRPHEQLIRFVADRPGHDLRYALDTSKVRQELEWRPSRNFDSALELSVQWYIQNRPWWEQILKTSYRGSRLGLSTGVELNQ